MQPHLRKCFDNLVHLEIRSTSLGKKAGDDANKDGAK